MLEKSLKRSRLMYIFEAALEYFISILVASSYLATLTKELGFSDSLTGILSSFISLGCLFQLFSLSIKRTRAKKFVIGASILNQLLFMSLYVIPLTSGQKNFKIALFAIAIFAAYFVYNIAHPKKINWLMSLVDDNQRGSFTANKEIVSLVSGMAFSFLMGAVIDYFSEIGKIRTAFLVSGIVIFVLMVLHSLTLIFTVEKEIPQRNTKDFKTTFKELFKNKNVLCVTIVFVFYYVSTYISVPFYGTYKINELGLNLKFISAITILGSASRICVSKFWGRYADKKSFAAMIEKCFMFLALAQICVVFATPTTGKILFTLYFLLHGIAMGGINSALINLIFDYVDVEKRANSLAITQAVAGVTGFVTTLLISPVISSIQKNGLSLFGMTIYAQQLVTFIALAITGFAIIYIRKVLMKMNKSN